MILLGFGKDKHIITKVCVHMMSVAKMLRFIKREEFVQDLEHCKYPRSGEIRNTMNGDQRAVLRPVVNAIQAPAEEHTQQPEVDAGYSQPEVDAGHAQQPEESASSPSLSMSPVSPRIKTSKHAKQAENVGDLLMRSMTMVCEDSVL